CHIPHLGSDPWRTIIVNKSGFKAGAKGKQHQHPLPLVRCTDGTTPSGKRKAHNVSIVDFFLQRWTLSGHMKIKSIYFHIVKYHAKAPAGAF
ncbi:hypothetical protein, partial [Escherichia coli]|uniref:hypothetical protein n=1 Tax=Escherichia coli TaxID=562 RepID=UPI001BAF4672